MAAHYTALTPDWSWEAPPNGSIRIPWHHDNYECLSSEVGGVYHLRSDVYRLNKVALEEGRACTAAVGGALGGVAAGGASAVAGMMTECRACYLGEPAVDFTVANGYGLELWRRARCAHTALARGSLGAGGSGGGSMVEGQGAVPAAVVDADCADVVSSTTLS